MRIGFIGQGWIGRHYADDFEARGYDVVRYSLEPEYSHNKAAIAKCDIVFIAVPTPGAGCDRTIVREALELVGPGHIAVIKSTVLPGTTQAMQLDFPCIYVLHSPEFLTEARAAYDAANPVRNIIGVPDMDDETREAAEAVLEVLPPAPYPAVMPAAAAELIKYAGNCLLYSKVVFINLLFNLAQRLNLDWSTIAPALAADKRLGATHLIPVHASGRGAGGHCFIKDFAALRSFYEQLLPEDLEGREVLEALEQKNVDLLLKSGKDVDLVDSIYPPYDLNTV